MEFDLHLFDWSPAAADDLRVAAEDSVMVETAQHRQGPPGLIPTVELAERGSEHADQPLQVVGLDRRAPVQHPPQ